MTELYIHIPFCKRKCDYCSFYSVQGEYFEEYTLSIIRAVQYFGKKTADTLSTVYIGGGTPSVLPIKCFYDIFDAVHRNFKLSDTAEITVECNPESTTEMLLTELRKCGVNRLSLGIQSFDDNCLKAVGRLHNGRQAEKAIKTAQSLGFDNISCDLIFGLPKSDLSVFENDLEKLVGYGIPHISCYNLQVEKGTPLYEKNTEYPDEEMQARMYFTACEYLEKSGYTHYEISNFAKPGKESRHNIGYWDGTDYIGIGPSAHSKTGDVRTSFSPDLKAFINRTGYEFDTSEKITDKEFEKLMLGLRTVYGYPLNMIKNSKSYTDKLVENGFATVKDGNLTLTDKGMYVSNTVISDIASKEKL